MDYGLHDSKIPQSAKVHHRKHIDLGSSVMLDQERCVLCARCTRFTSDITKTHELGIIGRGDHACVSTMPGKELSNPYAMNVVDLCPVGALTSKDFRFAQRVWFLTSTPSICHGCAKGCNIFIDHNKEKYKDEKVYRFRPRVNLDVNGHFICDEGRLSYKALQEDRQLQAVHRGEEIDFSQALKVFSEMIEASEQSVVILVDANLYTEELAALAALAEELKARIICPMESYRDSAFGDTWLKSEQRAANAEAVARLGIAEQLTDAESIDLLINVNHPNAANFSAQKTISFQTHKVFNADLTLPLAAFTESSGTLINEEGRVQSCQKAIHRNDVIPSVVEWMDMRKERLL